MSPRLLRLADTLTGLAVGAAAAALLLLSCGRVVASFDYRSSESAAYRRLWSDTVWAINDFVLHRFPPQPGETLDPAVDPTRAYVVVMLERTGQLDIKPWQFWRSFRPWIFREHRGPYELGVYDDRGRALLLARSFRLMGGVAPFLILWLAALAAAPALVWCVHEMWQSRRRVAAVVFAAAVATSPYVAETLTHARYAVGFYLVACLVAVALTTAVVLRPQISLAALAARFAAAGAALAVCISCRPSALFVLAGLALLLPVWLARFRHLGLLATALLAALLVAPAAVARPSKHHDVWIALWEGLGDFDRTKGHTWSDPVAQGVARFHGAPELWSPESEPIFRELVLSHIRNDPAWYAAILAKRAGSTVLQWKLWPYGPTDGLHMRRKTSDNEGFIDKYYGYTTTGDHIGFGTWTKEVWMPVWPGLMLILLLHSLLSRSADAAAVRTRRLEAGAVATLGVCFLGVPVAISTAGAQETQAFFFAYFLAAALLAERLTALAVINARPRR